MTDRPTTPPLRAVRIAANCPTCGKPGVTGYRPFCSKRCADIDLSRWLKGGYAIPGRPAGDEDEGEASKDPEKS
jgi:endogenous inhibitor of DNA gyrase (YacG/DUF329 family)